MNKNWVLTQESFDALLGWLDPEREKAGRKYEEIRRRLIKIFTCRGCHEPEDLADETINRVARKLKKISNDFVGEPSAYVFAVANKVYLEYRRRKPFEPRPAEVVDSTAVERDFACLEQCMAQLTAENRDLVLQYYQDDKQAKIDHRKQLAQQLGIRPNAVRIRAFRIRASLLECVEKCLAAVES